MPRDDGGNAGVVSLDDMPSDAPPWFVSMHADIGTREVTGKRHNPKVVAYFRDAGFAGIKDDETAWCAACVNAHLERNGITGSKSLAARSFEKWGKALDKPRLGCVVPLWRGSKTGWQGHVGLYVGETKTHVLLLGGNQSDSVNVAKFPKSRVLGYRWPRKPVELRTNQAAGGSAASGTVSAGLSTAAEKLEETAAPIGTQAGNPPVAVPEGLQETMQPLQDGLSQLAPFLRWAGVAAAVISVALALYVIYRRTKDHNERGL